MHVTLLKSQEECQRTERDAVKMASEMNAEFWSVSSKTGTHGPRIGHETRLDT